MKIKKPFLSKGKEAEKISDEFSPAGVKGVPFRNILGFAKQNRFSVEYVLDECKRLGIYLRAQDCVKIAGTLNKDVPKVVKLVKKYNLDIPEDREFNVLYKKCIAQDGDSKTTD